MAEVAPLLTRQAWELVTPMAASGAATGGAVGGAAGIGIAVLAVAAVAGGFAALRALGNRKTSAKTAAKKNGPAGGSQGAASAGRLGLLRSMLGGRGASRGAGSGPRGGSSGGRSAGGGRASGASAGGKKGPLSKLAGRLSPTKRGGAGSTGGRSPGRSTGSPTGSRSGGRNTGGAGGKKSLLGRGLSGVRSLVGKGGSRPAAGSGGGNGGEGAKPPGRIRRALGGGRSGVSGQAHPGKPSTGGQSAAGPKGGKVASGVRALLGKPAKGQGAGDGPTASASTVRPAGKRARLLSTKPPADTADAGRRGTSAVARRAIDNAATPTGKARRTLGETMKIRRPQINSTGLARTSAARLGSAPASGRTPFAAVIEACGVAATAYSPDNAQRAIEWYEGMPQLIEAIASMFAAHAVRNAEDFYLYPAAADIANALGAKFAAYRGPCDDARAAFEAAHAEDLAKLRDPKRNQEKWDILVNKD
jgi:hypothetical protein